MTAFIIGRDLFLLTFLIVPALGVWVAIDAGTKPPWAFERAGSNKTLWIVLPLAGVVFCGIATVVSAIVWFASVRPKVTAAAAGAPPWTGTTYPAAPAGATAPPGWYLDPAGRHQYRYFDGATWTPSVSDHGVTSTDPLPSS